MSNSIGGNAEIGPEVTRHRRSPFEVMGGYLRSGRFASDLCEEFDPLRAPLPDGYRYATASSVSVSEIANLWKSRRDDFAYTRSTLVDYGRTIINVGVRNTNQRLVGNGTLIHDMEGNGKFVDFFVRRKDRGLGVGKAIIDERLRIATALGVESIYIPDIDSTNTLESYYLEKGFVRLGGGGLALGPTRGSFNV